MNTVDFAKQVKQEMVTLHAADAKTAEEKQAIVNQAVENIRNRIPEADLKHVFDPNRELSQDELEQVTGGSIGGDIGGWVGKELGTAVGNIAEDVVSLVGKTVLKLF